MIEFGFYDSEDQDWHVIPVVALEQEICLVYMLQDPCKEGLHPTSLSKKQDTASWSCVFPEEEAGSCCWWHEHNKNPHM